MEPRPLFVAFGIPVSFDPFFVFGAFLFYSWSGGGQAGVYAVIAMVCFVIVHEFGHALTARSFGARTAITITFLGGFATYVPGRRLTTRHSILISAAGPVTQIAAALPVMWWTWHRYVIATPSQEDGAWALYQAVAWAGIALAVINLLPAWPLDGGHITEQLLRRAFGDRVIRPFVVFSLGLAAVMIVLYVARRSNPDASLFRYLDGPETGTIYDLSFGPALLRELRSLPGFIFGQTIFIPGFIAFGAYERLGQLNRAKLRIRTENVPTGREMAHDEALRRTRQAERDSWLSGSLGDFPRGWGASPWVQAHLDLLGGRPDDAAQHLEALADDHQRRWLVDRPDRPEIGHLLAYVPSEALTSLAVLEARVHHGTPEEMVALASALFAEERSADPLYLGAAGLAARGLEDEAMEWLRRAVALSPDPQRMAIEREYHVLHRRSDFQQLLGEAERAAAGSRS